MGTSLKNKKTVARRVENAGEAHVETPKGWFSPADLCILVKACGDAGLVDFSYRDLKFSFTKKIDLVTEDSGTEEMVSPVLKPVSRETGPEFEEELLADLLLSNPAEYERIIEKQNYLDGENDKRAESVLRRGEKL